MLGAGHPGAHALDLGKIEPGGDVADLVLGLGGALNVPVACGGVMVNPGDAILADESGILVLAPDEVDAVADEALARQAREPELLRRIEAGEKLGAISGASAKVGASS